MAADDGVGVELVEAFAHRVGGVHHHRLRELADVVAEDAVGREIDRRHRHGRRELDLEVVEGGRADRAAEARDRRLADAGARRELGDGEARGGAEILADDFGDAALGRAQLRLDPLDPGDEIDRRRGGGAVDPPGMRRAM